MTDRESAAELELWAALAGEDVDEFDDSDHRRHVPAGYAADGVCGPRCPTSAEEASDEFIERAVAAVEEWLARNDPLDRRAFDQLRSRFAREPGEPAVPEQSGAEGRCVHIREVDGAELGRWAARADVALLDLDDEVRFADLHGVPFDDGDRLVPLVVGATGVFGSVASDFHTQYHALQRVRDRVDGSGRVLTDGGPADQADPERTDIARDEWQRLIDALDTIATPGELGRALADARDLPDGRALDLVDDALEAGELRLEDTDAAFDPVTVPQQPNRGQSDREEPDSPDATPGADPERTASSEVEAAPATLDSWHDADFSVTDSDTYPPAWHTRDQWMGHVEKKPFAPWADRDHPVADPDEDARWKWGITDNYVDGDTVAMAEDDPRLDGRAFLQQPDDPFAYVDGDDVRDPDTGEVHPAFIEVLERLGISYADVSQSGSGVHVIYRGHLPADVKQAAWQLDDEPFGGNDEPPSIEVYPGKRVCVATGEHVPGTGRAIAHWDDDALEDVLDENDQLPDTREVSAAREEFDLDEYEPDVTAADETTDDIRDLFATLDRLDARRVADRTIVASWNDDASTSEGNRAFAPTWGPSANGTANIVDDQIWQDTGDRGGYGGPAVMAAIDHPDLAVDETATPRDVRGADWFEAVDHLRDLGFVIPEFDDTDADQYTTDPTTRAVTLDPREAWAAAAQVRPEELDTSLEIDSADGGWLCPVCSGHVDDVAVAVAVDQADNQCCQEPLSAAYGDAYRRARERFGAPLPEYFTAADAVERWDKVRGAIDALDFWYLDRDAMATQVTAEGSDVGGQAVLAMDPSWRESQTGESVLVFESGTVWDADTEQTIDPLRFVALDAGLIETPLAPLEGETFGTAYRLAREGYGAPLPRWHAGQPDHTPMLPPAEDLVEDPTVADDDLQDARDDVETLYREHATDADTPSLIRTLPATGKTTATIKTAADQPTTYLARRKELMKQAAQKADRWGVSYQHLPTFSDHDPSEAAVSAAVDHVLDRGQSRLRDRWAVVDAIEDAVYPDPDDSPGGDDGSETVDIDRPTCPTAEGEHGEAWALVVHVARELDYAPRDIHERATALFGAELPCQHDGDCEYSAGWEDVCDGGNPADLLIGHYSHAHVESARTYYEGEDPTDKSSRVVVLDEYPGLAYAEQFGDEYMDHVTWLASALLEEVQDRQDLLETDLWHNDWVRAWLAGDAGDPADGPAADAVDGLEAREQLLQTVGTADYIRSEYPDLLDDYDLRAPLDRLVDAYPDLSADDRAEIATSILREVSGLPPETDGIKILDWLADDVAYPLQESATAGDLEVSLDSLPIGGELASFVQEAVAAADERRDDAYARLRAAQDALCGGEPGARELAVWADDGYAHRQAHRLLEAVIVPTDDLERAGRIETDEFAYGDNGGTTLKRVVTDGPTVLIDRNEKGATILDPPERTCASGDPAPIAGLDATGREELWALAIGDDIEAVDIHDSKRERARFLRDVLGLQLVQMSDQVRYYEGDPGGKDLDGDVAMLEEIAAQFSGVQAPRDRADDPVTIGDPAVVTTKGVRNVLESDTRLDGAVSAWENYGNLKGSNDLGAHTLAALLGCQHYGDQAVEHVAALAGEEVDRSGRGANLDYGSPIANVFLEHMREDQVMQAALRFTRGDSGAIVFARTSALRDDLPVVGDGQIVKTWSETATAIARECRRQGGEFTRRDVQDAVDVSERSVRRVLSELVDAGYLSIEESGAGIATAYAVREQPGAGEVELPSEVENPANPAADPGHADTTVYYTANVRVHGLDHEVRRADRGLGTPVPAPPAVAAEGDPPPTPD